MRSACLLKGMSWLLHGSCRVLSACISGRSAQHVARTAANCEDLCIAL